MHYPRNTHNALDKREQDGDEDSKMALQQTLETEKQWQPPWSELMPPIQPLDIIKTGEM